MTKTLTYKIEFFTYWHTSSGLSAGTEANATVIRNKHKLPYIPGKTIKGLLREAAEKLQDFSQGGVVKKEFIDTVFGIGDDVRMKEAAAQNREVEPAKTTACFFSNAELSNELTTSLVAAKEQAWLYETISSTAINEQGLAKENALRTMEVTIPLTLFGKIEQFPEDANFREQLDYCLQWIKRLGLNRNRGLGRCEWSIEKAE